MGREGEKYGVRVGTICRVTQGVYYLHDCTAASTDIFCPLAVYDPSSEPENCPLHAYAPLNLEPFARL